MPIQTGARGATIFGRTYAPYTYIDWFTPDEEAIAMQGGDATVVPARGLTGREVIALSGLAAATPIALRAPLGVAALAGNGYATVYFEAQPNVTGYLAVASTGESVSGTSSPITMALGNNVSRSIRVYSVYDTVTSLPSLPSNVVTPSALASTAMGAQLAAGLEFWIEPRRWASPPANLATVPTVLDSSGNGYHFGLDGNLFTAATWLSAWSSGKPALTFDGTGSSGYTTRASGLAANTYGPVGTICAVFDIAGQPNPTGVYEQRLLSCEGQSGNPYAVAFSQAGWALAITPTANSGARNCVSIHSASNATLNGRGAALAIQSAELTTIGQKLMVIALAPGVAHVSQNGGATWTQVAGIGKPGCEAFGNFTGASAANYCWALGSMQNGSFAANFKGHLGMLTKHNRVFNSSDVTLAKAYMATVI